MGITGQYRREATCSLCAQDSITKGSWAFNSSALRGDFYNGLTTHREAEPRLGVAYNVKRTNTVFRVSYARTMESPFNENLVLSSLGCGDPVLNPASALLLTRHYAV